MVLFVLRRLAQMLLVIMVVGLLLFLSSEGDPKMVARGVLGPYAQDEQLQLWVEKNGLDRNIMIRYVEWIERLTIGDFGESVQYKKPVNEIFWSRLGNTAILGLSTLVVMVPLALILGIFAGIKEASPQDRIISTLSIITTSIPEYASSVIVIVIFAYWLDWLPGVSAMADGFVLHELILPTFVLVLYGFGYIARMTRASMAEVMTTHYIRTAILKGLPMRDVIFKHALRNALIAPFTVILLQLNWLLSGVVVTEFAFGYNGFGRMLLDAALSRDIYVLQACAIVAVFIAVISQTLGDVGYAYLNPRIRFK